MGTLAVVEAPVSTILSLQLREDTFWYKQGQVCLWKEQQKFTKFIYVNSKL